MMIFKAIIRFVTMALAAALAMLPIGCSEELVGPSSTPPLMNRPSVAEAQYVLIPIGAIVTSVADSTLLLGGAVSVGDTVRGSCLYDETAQDVDSKPDRGKYLFDAAPCLMDFSVNGLQFRSDPSGPALTIRLANDDPENGQSDSARFISSNNLEVLPGVGVAELHIMMIDRSSAALSSDSLLGTHPFEAEWPDKHQLTIAGVSRWRITAEITVFADDEETMSEEPSEGTTKIRFHEE
ncbi:MAG: hypothetical protein HY770_06040 [Chitinivibrionia bacterium]|nr:hypothetical protein [Chitinivibrionia bacterium]